MAHARFDMQACNHLHTHTHTFCAPGATAVLPNGIATGLDIGFSNYSLVFISLSFYVMCKSTTPMFLLVFAFIWRIERCDGAWVW